MNLQCSTPVFNSKSNPVNDQNWKATPVGLIYSNNSSLNGVEAVGDTLEEMWISYNNIEKLKGINVLKKLKVLYIRVTNVKDMSEFSKLVDLPNMKELGFVGNPLAESGQEVYTETITKKLPKLKRLDATYFNLCLVFDKEAVGDTLEELWISYNNIEKLKGINVLKKLKVDLPNMKELGFVGNPLADSLMEIGQEVYTETITKKLPKLKRLDGFTVIRQD
ncbi:dynein axonemal light chain 1-like [Dreissena polymorpha]|uniref:dynein axonemal light chain 1-like n=1 Tax=Dreissena polymorpha TaxID=45954 RepID=UPI0022649A54|nr:dynein axonemal light chain 1-like [Dreissena polymorpha]